uniref:disease resistance protein RPS6-like n=1 Tax=Fragaria vesca subsp. vesca TaxID=101020 RepID=UPI0005C84924|nr:PREDICTED: disease resistance protein RPS6-like [Fragaria vesca subsp. vesca]
MDAEELEVGKAISPNLLMAIEESRFAIVVLSPKYASSTWCLDELTKILQSMEGRDRILPIFYDVDPSHVRHQLGTSAEAFAMHEENSRESKEKLDRWRLALKNVADLSGWDTTNFRSERELLKRIVKFVCNKVLQVPPRPIPIEFNGQPTEVFESTTRARDGLTKALKHNKVQPEECVSWCMHYAPQPVISMCCLTVPNPKDGSRKPTDNPIVQRFFAEEKRIERAKIMSCIDAELDNEESPERIENIAILMILHLFITQLFASAGSKLGWSFVKCIADMNNYNWAKVLDMREKCIAYRD